ncbi:UNVERIFIED_CONTAM: hypothetical protein HDU68_005588 [Siphonaria sp. JEL0065]|nr:hypothetical protein HDU68_005588 [Siphonaria sp. JEL0065]
MEELHSFLAGEFEQSRATLKEIKSREESLGVIKKKQRDLQSKLDAALKKGSSAPRSILGGSDAVTDLIRMDLGNLDREVMVAQADFEGFKREAFKNASKRKWNAIIEFSAKMIVLANFGNHISDQIPQGKLAPGYDLPAFKNAHIISQIMSDYESQSAQWRNFIPSDLNFSSSTGTSNIVSTSLEDLESPTTSSSQFQQQPIEIIKPESVREEIYNASLAVNTTATTITSSATTTSAHSPAAPNAFKTVPSLQQQQTYVSNNSNPIFSNTTATTITNNESIYAAESIEPSAAAEGEIFMDAVPVYPSSIHNATTVTTSTTNIASGFVSPVQPGYLSGTFNNQNQSLHSTDPSLLARLDPVSEGAGRRRPVSNLAAAVAEAVGPLGRIPAGSAGAGDKKGSSGSSGAPVVGATGILASVGDGVTEMLRAAQQQQQQQQQTQIYPNVGGGGGDVRRMSSLALALAEGGEDDKKGVGVGGRNTSVGDGVTGMLREMTNTTNSDEPQQSVVTPAAPPATTLPNAPIVKPLLGTFVVMFDYEQTPGKADEVSIVVGDLVDTSNVYEDGWGYGRVLV